MAEDTTPPTPPAQHPPTGQGAQPPQPAQEKSLPDPRAPEEALPAGRKMPWGIIGILLVVVAGGAAAYYFFVLTKTPTLEPETTTPIVVEEATEAAEPLEVRGTSDEIDAIEADLLGTDLSTLDKELTDIESELNAQ